MYYINAATLLILFLSINQWRAEASKENSKQTGKDTAELRRHEYVRWHFDEIPDYDYTAVSKAVAFTEKNISKSFAEEIKSKKKHMLDNPTKSQKSQKKQIKQLSDKINEKITLFTKQSKDKENDDKTRKTVKEIMETFDKLLKVANRGKMWQISTSYDMLKHRVDQKKLDVPSISADIRSLLDQLRRESNYAHFAGEMKTIVFFEQYLKNSNHTEKEIEKARRRVANFRLQIVLGFKKEIPSEIDEELKKMAKSMSSKADEKKLAKVVEKFREQTVNNYLQTAFEISSKKGEKALFNHISRNLSSKKQKNLEKYLQEIGKILDLQRSNLSLKDKEAQLEKAVKIIDKASESLNVQTLQVFSKRIDNILKTVKDPNKLVKRLEKLKGLVQQSFEDIITKTVSSSALPTDVLERALIVAKNVMIPTYTWFLSVQPRLNIYNYQFITLLPKILEIKVWKIAHNKRVMGFDEFTEKMQNIRYKLKDEKGSKEIKAELKKLSEAIQKLIEKNPELM